MTTEKITQNRNEYRTSTVRGSIVAIGYSEIGSLTAPGTFFQDTNHICTQHELPIRLFHLDRVNAVKLEPLIEHRGHAGKEDPFATERFDTLFEKILPIHAVGPYAKVAGRHDDRHAERSRLPHQLDSGRVIDRVPFLHRMQKQPSESLSQHATA